MQNKQHITLALDIFYTIAFLIGFCYVLTNWGIAGTLFYSILCAASFSYGYCTRALHPPTRKSKPTNQS